MLKKVVLKTKSFVILFSIFLCNFISNGKYSNASFFKTCGIRENEVKTIEYVLQNGTSKFIPSKIEDIYNDDFQKAVYLYLFYRDAVYSNFTMPIDVIDFIGFQNVEKVNRFKLKVLNYLLSTDISSDELKKRIVDMRLKDNEKLRLLQNRLFISRYEKNHNFIDKKVIEELIVKAVSYNIVGYEDIKELMSVYKEFFTDELLLQQIRVRLFYKNSNNIDKIIDLMKGELYRRQAVFLINFDNELHTQKSYVVTNKKGRKITKYRALSADEINRICKKNLGKDEYIDLICLKKHHKNFDYVESIIKDNDNPKFLPNKWLKYRLSQAREGINGKTSLRVAYKKIANAGFLRGEDFYTQHFLAGFIAYLNKQYHDAVYHFVECTNHSTYAESVAKAHYWLGLSFEKLHNKLQADSAFEKASEYVFTFYGQLASEEIGKNPEKLIKTHLQDFSIDNKRLCKDVMFIAGYLDQLYSKNSGVSSLLTNYIEKNQQNKNDLYNSIDIIYKDFDRKVGIGYGYYNLRYNVALPAISFPRVVKTTDSLVNAVIKQESNFNHKAISNKGARGMMQIMPSTGKKLAKDMGIKYDHNRLLHDPDYNVEMGMYYINLLLDKFGGHKVLSLASYNAGALNVGKWMDKNGDPKNMEKNEEIATWIEKIPFVQTRGYVVSILGSEMVYDVIQKM